MISILSLELAKRMAHIVNGDLDPEILAKPTDDELLPLDEAEPAKFDQNTDLVQSIIEEENNNLPTAKHTNEKEEDHTNIPGMRLRPKRNVNFKNDDFGKDYDDFDHQNQVRRSTRVPHKKEDSEFITYKPHQAFPTEPVHNSGYSTRLRTKRGETLPFEDHHKEEKKESLNIVLPREVIQSTVKPTVVETPVENAGNQIKLRKAQTKTRSYQEKISGESFIIEAIEGGNLGWKGLEEKSQKPTPVAAPVETNRNGRTRTSQRLNQSNGAVIEEKKEEEGYRVRLRRPGKSTVYKEEDEDEFGEEEEEELDYGGDSDDDEVVFNKKQKKQQNKQNKKQQILDFNLAQQQPQANYGESQEAAQETRVTRAKRRITEHYKTSNIDDDAEDPDETSTKIRLTLPPVGESSEAKRYNTRGQRR